MSVDFVLMEDVRAVDTADQLVLQPRSPSTLKPVVQYTILSTHVRTLQSADFIACMSILSL